MKTKTFILAPMTLLALVALTAPAFSDLTVTPTSVAPGGTVTATWSGIASPTSGDWIGLFTPQAAHTAFIDWIWTSCSQTQGSPRASGSCNFVLPGNLAEGNYQLRLFANESFTLIFTSNNFTVTTPSIRFTLLLGDQAVLDSETGLIWERSPATGATGWYTAFNDCFDKNVGGRKGWRPPTVEELASLLEPGAIDNVNVALPPGHPFINVQPDRYWTATGRFSSDLTLVAEQAMLVHFRTGVVAADRRTDPHLVWCVLGGQGRQAQ